MTPKPKPKTLLPETLPNPRHSKTRLTPRERAIKRAAALLSDPKLLGPVAGALALSSCGFAVVDPMPPPTPNCQDFNETWGPYIGEVSAQYDTNPQTDGRFAVNFWVNLNAIPDGLSLGPIDITGGSLRETPALDSSMLFPIVPSVGATTLIVDLLFGCSFGDTEAHQWVIALTDPPQPGGSLNVTGS